MNGFLQRFGKIYDLLSIIGFIVLGLALIVICIIIIVKPDDRVFVETTGTIVNIVEEYSSFDDSNNYQVFVDYSVDGKDYKNVEYGAYNSKMKVGDSVTILYNQDDPTDITSPGSDKVVYFVLAAGILSLLVGVGLILKRFIIR